MIRKRSILEVKILLDPIPGWGSKPEDHLELLRSTLKTTIAWYNPEVRLLGVEEVPDERP